MDSYSVEYAIDDHYRLIRFNNDWDRFALENDSGHLSADKIKMRSLFDFISEAPVRYVWRSIIERARKTREPVEFEYRCDSPTVKRFMRMQVAQSASLVQFTSAVLRTEKSQSLQVFDISLPRNQSIISVCSWCKRIRIRADFWAEPEIAVNDLRLFEDELFPQISHGICPECELHALVD